MIPDTDRPYTPGWFFKVLFNQLCDREYRDRITLLHNYRIGKAPLPRGAEKAREAFEAFSKLARTNFADLIVSALSERMWLTGFQSAADNDITGDPDLGSLWVRAGLDVLSGDVHKATFSKSVGYVMVGEIDEETDAAVVTEEDPLFCIGLPDPDRPRKLIAGLKVKHDEAEDVDRAYLFMAGKVFGPGQLAQCWVAERKSKLGMGPMFGFDFRSWDWVPARSGFLKHDRVPIVRFDNESKLGEYEPHLDIMDRINHGILQRLVIGVLQAWKQRAVKGLPGTYPKGHPDEGKPIDYGDVFQADPAAVWQLPPGVEMWESGAVDLAPIINGGNADIQQLASVTRTPLHMMMPAGDNQSAEGANLQREGLTFKARDRIRRTSHPWVQVKSLMLLQAGETDLKALARLRPIWASPELLSLSERADAASKARADIPLRSLLTLIWQFPPDVVEQMMTERLDDQVLAQQFAQALAASQPLPQAGPVPSAPTAPTIPIVDQRQPAGAGASAGTVAAAA